jgi:lysozyme
VNTALLTAELKRDEGLRLQVYNDSLGKPTIGIGRLVGPGGGISEAEAEYLLANDIARVAAFLDARLPWWRAQNETRQHALMNMAFQLGGNLLSFSVTLPLIRDGRYAQAGINLRKSLWHKQTPARADRVIAMIELG